MLYICSHAFLALPGVGWGGTAMPQCSTRPTACMALPRATLMAYMPQLHLRTSACNGLLGATREEPHAFVSEQRAVR
jgi:hypothetical protein